MVAAATWDYARWAVVSKKLREFIACGWLECITKWGYHRFQMTRGNDSFYECLKAHLSIRNDLMGAGPSYAPSISKIRRLIGSHLIEHKEELAPLITINSKPVFFDYVRGVRGGYDEDSP